MVENRRHKDDRIEVLSKKVDLRGLIATVGWYGKRFRGGDILIPPPASLIGSRIEIPAPTNIPNKPVRPLLDVSLKTVLNGGGYPRTRKILDRYGIRLLPSGVNKVSNSTKEEAHDIVDQTQEIAQSKPVSSVHLAQGDIVELEKDVFMGGFGKGKRPLAGVIERLGENVDIYIPLADRPLAGLVVPVPIDYFRSSRVVVDIPDYGRYRVVRIYSAPELPESPDLAGLNKMSLRR